MNLLQALPRTPLWDRLKREDRLIEDDDRRESNVAFHLPYEQVVAMWRECMRVAYQPEALIARYEHQIEVAYRKRFKPPNRVAARHLEQHQARPDDPVAHGLAHRHQGRLPAACSGGSR